jgi:hypothetical protein
MNARCAESAENRTRRRKVLFRLNRGQQSVATNHARNYTPLEAGLFLFGIISRYEAAPLQSI